ncbi:c-type cytochrome biogenesis protein CcmI [Paracoccus methylarcula]|uniref:c-type cytochrome biogenesis protein CcmI n=1 Tax=Paracoccus methylarcula TaxID=72022 RepID=UPI001FE2A582|nr:c-type cytochrome biogenesis protein CcmI [Paracoccus methylarcula]
MFWLLSALLTLVVAAAITVPLRRARDAEAPSAASYDLRVYRDQLREVERDLERGVIGEDEAGRLRNEIGRKVLETDRRLAEATPSRHGGGMAGAAVALAVLLVGAVGLYLYQAPRMPRICRCPSGSRWPNAPMTTVPARPRPRRRPPSPTNPMSIRNMSPSSNSCARRSQGPPTIRKG